MGLIGLVGCYEGSGGGGAGGERGEGEIGIERKTVWVTLCKNVAIM